MPFPFTSRGGNAASFISSLLARGVEAQQRKFQQDRQTKDFAIRKQEADRREEMAAIGRHYLNDPYASPAQQGYALKLLSGLAGAPTSPDTFIERTAEGAFASNFLGRYGGSQVEPPQSYSAFMASNPPPAEAPPSTGNYVRGATLHGSPATTQELARTLLQIADRNWASKANYSDLFSPRLNF